MRDVIHAFLFALGLACLLSLLGLTARGDILAEKASTAAAVCKLVKIEGRSMPTGSGTLVGASADGRHGLVITAYHVAGRRGRAEVRFANVPELADRVFPGTVFRGDPANDLSAVLIHNPGIPPVWIDDLRALTPVEGRYYACGYPSGRGFRVFAGRVARMNARETLIDSPIVPGVSGGALFDETGYYCGVTNARQARSGRGWSHTLANAGHALDDFLAASSQQCGVLLRRRAARRDPGLQPALPAAPALPQCPDGRCPIPSAMPYGYQHLNPTPAIAAAPAPPAAAPVVAAAPLVPAPQPDNATMPADQVPRPAGEHSIVAQRSDPRLDALIALAEERWGVKIDEPTEADAAELVARLPTLTLTVDYHDGRPPRQAVISTRELVLRQLGVN